MTMSEKTYFVTLSPQQLFFFGGEQGVMADYYLKGSFWPQQTALLGLVRHQVLIQNDLLLNNKIKNTNDAAEWIGAESFKSTASNPSFGKVKSLSPCYLVQDSEGEQAKFLPYHQPYIKGVKCLSENFYLPDFNPKNHYPDVWSGIDKSQCISNTNDKIYQEIERVGVNKNYDGKTEEKSFFKQIWLKMNKAYSFGFYVSLAEDVIFKTHSVTFGKESAPFKMEVGETEREVFEDEHEPSALVLISDTYVEVDILSDCDFAVTNTIPFRNIVNHTSKTYRHSEQGKNKSDFRLQLFKRGSVFFSKHKINRLIMEIESKKHFRKIGYNHYHLLNIPY